MLQKLTIEGLRGFSQKREIQLALPNGNAGSGLTLLTGPNNSGKSTIIEAIKVRSAVHRLPSFHIGMRNTKTDAVNITYLIDGIEETVKSSRAGSSETISDRTSDLTPYIVPSRRQFSPHFGKSNATDRKQYTLQSGSNDALRGQTLTGFEGRLFELEKNHEEFDKIILEIFPDFMNWSIDQNDSEQFFVKMKSGEKTHSLSGGGDGVISTFVIVAALFDSTAGDVIAIDEPELSLHPTIQRRLANTISRFSSDRQIVISTHSPYFVLPEALRNGAQVIRTWDRKDSIEVYHLSANSCKSLRRLLSPNANNPHVFGLDAREIFFSGDPILVFEGQEDVLFWPKASAARPALATASTYGWGAGGAANVVNVLAVLEALGFMRVAAILDNNRPDDVKNLTREFPNYHIMELPASDIRTKEARPASAEVNGLLDAAGNVRPELASSLNTRLDILASFLSS
jgi:predicted ATPase